MTNGPVERWLVLEDGTATLLERERKTRSDRWSLRVGCGGCLAWLVAVAVLGALAVDEVWIGVSFLAMLGTLALAEQLARHSWGDVERYLERSEGGSEGWTKL